MLACTQRVRHTQVVHSPRECLHHLSGCHAVIGMGLVQIQAAGIELEGRDAARIHHLDGHGLARIQRPAHVVVDQALVRPAGQHAQEKVVTAEHGVGALVHHGRIAHLEMGMTRVGGLHGRLEAGGIAHLGIAVTGGPGRGRGVTTAGMHAAAGRERILAVVLRQQRPRNVQFAAADVRMQVDGAAHHHAAGEIDVAIDSRIRPWCGHDAAILDIEIADLAIDAVRRVVDPAILKPQHDSSLPG